MVHSVKDYRSYSRFSLIGKDLAENRIISRTSSSSEKICLPREVKPPGSNLTLVLKSISHLPYESLKLFSDKHI